MKRLIAILLVSTTSMVLCGQSMDDTFSKKKMQKDLAVFKEIRLKANSGLYKYRSKDQVDSIYQWAENEIAESNTYRDFYNIICQLTDFEGSCHNDTEVPDKYFENIRQEDYGYFPYPIKWIDGKWLINYNGGEIPLGAAITKINGSPIKEIITNLYKYYHTDGSNITGKRIGIRTHFSRYFRFHYGLQKDFEVSYTPVNSDVEEQIRLSSSSYLGYYENFRARHSKPMDQVYYARLKENQKYKYSQLNDSTSILTIRSFSMGNESTKEHKTYATFLDSIFSKLQTDNIHNLIVDVRTNSGGDDPNDVLTYAYLTSRNFQESKEAWISFQKIPLLKHYNSSIPRFLRSLLVGKYNRRFQHRFPIEKDGRYYMGKGENEMKVRTPKQNAFTGNVYLLSSPAIASASSLFASMVAGNDNTTVIGEETMGGYYGHNGHTSLEYVLPKSKLVSSFFVENIEQDVISKDNQYYDRGIIPDYITPQSTEDFLSNEDTQMNFTLKLIGEN